MTVKKAINRTTRTYTSNTKIDLSQISRNPVVEVAFINKGVNDVSIDGLTLSTDQGVSFSNDQNVETIQKYNVEFTGGTGQLVVIIGSITNY